MNASKRKQSILYMVELAVLTAIVLVLQITGAAIRIPFLGTSVSLVLIPIALGAMLLGPAAGAWLGFVFGAITYIMGGVMGLDPFTLSVAFYAKRLQKILKIKKLKKLFKIY